MTKKQNSNPILFDDSIVDLCSEISKKIYKTILDFHIKIGSFYKGDKVLEAILFKIL